MNNLEWLCSSMSNRDLGINKGNRTAAGQRECTYLTLFLKFLKIGAFTFGGGYSMIPLIQKEMVENMCWMDDRECADIIGVTQIAPGAVAINMSIYIGYKLMGAAGATVAAFGIILPSFLIITVIAAFFSRITDASLVNAFFMGARPGIVAMIAYAAYRMSGPILQDRASWILALLALGAV